MPPHADIQQLNSRLLRFRSDPEHEDAIALAEDLLTASRYGDARGVVVSAQTDERELDGRLLVLEGRAWYLDRDLVRAQAALVKAAKVHPQSSEAYRWLGEVLLERGDPSRALKSFERAFATRTPDADGARLLELARARSSPALPAVEQSELVAVSASAESVAEPTPELPEPAGFDVAPAPLEAATSLVPQELEPVASIADLPAVEIDVEFVAEDLAPAAVEDATPTRDAVAVVECAAQGAVDDARTATTPGLGVTPAWIDEADAARFSSPSIEAVESPNAAAPLEVSAEPASMTAVAPVDRGFEELRIEPSATPRMPHRTRPRAWLVAALLLACGVLAVERSSLETRLYVRRPTHGKRVETRAPVSAKPAAIETLPRLAPTSQPSAMAVEPTTTAPMATEQAVPDLPPVAEDRAQPSQVIPPKSEAARAFADDQSEPAAGKLEPALSVPQPLVHGSGREATTLAAHGDALFASDRVDEAAGAYNAALALDPLLPQALLGRAEVFLRAERPSDALVFLERAKAAVVAGSAPPEVRARMTTLLGHAYVQRAKPGDMELARELLRNAAFEPVAPAEASFWLGEAVGGRRTPEAAAAFKRYLELAPNGPYAARAKRALGPLL